MPNSVPYEVLAAPFTLYAAIVGTAFPLVDAVPAVAWVKIGTSGPLNYDGAAGVVVEHRQTLQPWRSLGDAGSRKIFRDEEDQVVRMTLVDVTLEHYRHAINRNTVTTVAAGVSTVGYKKLGLSRGFTVDTMALLCRADSSPYMADGKMQYEIPIAAQGGSPQVGYVKATPAGLSLEWMTLVDPSQSAAEYFGRLVCQHLPANT